MAGKGANEIPGTAAFLPLTPAVFHIMLALADGESHGYGLMLEVAQITKGATAPGAGHAVPLDSADAHRWLDRGAKGCCRPRNRR